MPTIEEAKLRLAELKSQGKSESTSKEAGKMAQIIKGDREAKPSGMGSSGSFGGGDFGSILSQATNAFQQSMQPAVDQLKTAQTTLQDRYKTLIEGIKGQQTTAENRQTATTAAELGRRGILPSSGVGQQEITSALQPVTSNFAAQAAQAGVQGAESEKGVLTQIANLLSQGGQGAISTALQLAQMGQQQNQFQAQQDLANRQFEQISLPSASESIRKSQQVSSGSNSYQDQLSLLQALGINIPGINRGVNLGEDGDTFKAD